MRARVARDSKVQLGGASGILLRPSKKRQKRDSSVTEDILALLTVEFPDEFSPKIVARATGHRHATVRTVMARMAKQGRIVKRRDGYYRALMKAEHLPEAEIKYHNIHLYFKIADCCAIRGRAPDGAILYGKVGDGPDSIGNLFKLQWQKPKGGRKSPLMATALWRERVVKFEMYVKSGRVHGNVAIHIRATDDPLTYPDWRGLVDWLDGMFRVQFGTSLLLHPITVKVAEPGIDYLRLKLDQVQGVTLTGFDRAWFRFYNHGKQTRLEEHIPDALPLVDACNILRDMYFKSLQFKKDTEIAKATAIVDAQKELDRLTRESQRRDDDPAFQ